MRGWPVSPLTGEGSRNRTGGAHRSFYWEKCTFVRWGSYRLTSPSSCLWLFLAAGKTCLDSPGQGSYKIWSFKKVHRQFPTCDPRGLRVLARAPLPGVARRADHDRPPVPALTTRRSTGPVTHFQVLEGSQVSERPVACVTRTSSRRTSTGIPSAARARLCQFRHQVGV